MAVNRDSTGLEYSRTVDEAEAQKQRMTASVDRMYSIATYIFAIGLIAVGALCVISFLNNAPKMAIICEIVVFLCLVLLLVLILRSKKRVNEQRRYSERYPYKSVNKKEIDNIFNLIADEEKKRERLDRFAMSGSAGASASKAAEAASRDTERNKPVVESKPSTPKPEPKEESAVKSNTPSPEVPEEEDSGIIHIFPDEDSEMVSVLDDEVKEPEVKKESSAKSEPERKESKEENSEKPVKPSAEESEAPEGAEPPKKKRPRNPDGTRPGPNGKRPPQGASKGKKRPNGAPAQRDPRDPRAPQQGGQGAKKRRPPQGYDPYYGGGAYYYDEYGRPVGRRMPPYDPYYGGGYYYDEYGQPIRRREPEGAVYYDEYGRPVRRRPPQGYDPRREDAARRKRAPGAPGAPGSADQAKRRPDAAKAGAPAKQSKAAPLQPENKRTAAPVAMPSLKKDIDDEHITVFIPYDDEVDNAYEQPSQGGLKANQRKGGPAAAPRPVVMDESEYSPQDMEAVPIIIPDDDYASRYDDEEQAYVPPAAASRAPAAPRPQPARNVPDYYYEGDDSAAEQDTGVVVVPDFEDFDSDEDRYSRGRFSGNTAEQAYQPPTRNNQQGQAYSAAEEEDYSYEDEGVVVLPHDEGYESYLEKVKEEEEKKRIEERKLARKQSGKIALTIRKVRRRKIHRKSRRYKRFRASVIPLAKYLSDYDS